MIITYGCDCQCSNHIGYDKVPAAFLIERDGKEMKVCTRCDLSRDKYLARLFDAETEMGPFSEFDILGAFCIAGMVDDEAWEERKAIKGIKK